MVLPSRSNDSETNILFFLVNPMISVGMYELAYYTKWFALECMLLLSKYNDLENEWLALLSKSNDLYENVLLYSVNPMICMDMYGFA